MLTGEDENVVSGGAPPQATLAKCSPPIRNRHNQRMLVEGLEEGAITSMSTMSLMFDVRQKMMHTNDLIRSVSGTDGLETFVSSCWTWCRQFQKSPVILAEIMAKEPARLLGLSAYKGVLRVGAQADFCVLKG